MSGICGVVGSFDKNLLKKMSNAFCYKDDSEIIFTDKQVALIERNNRKSELLEDEKGTTQLICDAKIYNYELLQRELEEKKHKFKTTFSEEIIVHLYEKHREQCPKFIDGDFVFAIYDSKNKRIILARDTVGLKILYYFFDDQTFIFASEIKPILEYGIKREVDLDSLNHYMCLSSSYVPCEYTMFKGIKRLPPGHFLSFDLKTRKMNVQKFCDITDFKDIKKHEHFFVEKLRHLVEESIRKRIPDSQKPIGLLLSGGLDSTSILSVLNKFENPIYTYTAGFNVEAEQEKYNIDKEIARQISQQFDTNHHELVITAEEFRKNIKEVLFLIEEPISNSSQVPQLLLSKIAKKNVEILFTGDGGDEVFGGYQHYYKDFLISKYQRLPKIIRNYVITPLADNVLRKKFEGFNEMFNCPDDGRRFMLFASRNREIIKQINRDFIKDKTTELIDRRFYLSINKLEAPSTKKLSYLDLKTRTLDNFSTQMSKITTACGLEYRCPLLDRNLVEFSFKIPLHLKIKIGLKEGTTRYIQKKVFSDILPKSVLTKRAFFSPTAKWIRKDLKDMVYDYLSKSALEKTGFFNSEYVHRILEDHISLKKYNRDLIWSIFTFQVWYDLFIEKIM